MGLDLDEDEDSNMEEVINISSEVMRFELDGMKFKLQPKEVVQIHRNHAIPKILQKDRDPVASTIEMLTNKKVLSVKDKRARAALSGKAAG
jgi:hypothetical protein